MKKRLLSGAASLLLLILFIFPAAAADTGALDDDIMSSVGTLLTGGYDTLTLGDEWMVFAVLGFDGDADLSTYEKDVLDGVDSVSGAVERQRVALALTAIGHADSDFVRETPDVTVGEGGVMSYIFGLHLANNGVVGSRTADNIISELVALRQTDGGWCVFGETSDVDVTAMTVTALAPNRGKDSVDGLIGGALAFLSEKQNERGGFSSFGAENAESAAQVMIALASLGLNPDGDPDFTKNSHTVADALAEYRCPDATYRHTPDGSSNKISTLQAITALVAYKRYIEEKSPLLVFEKADNDVTGDPGVTASQNTPHTANETDDQTEPDRKKTEKTVDSYKPIIAAIIAAVAVIIVIVMSARRDHDVRDYIIVILIAAIAVTAVFLINIESPGEHFSGTAPEETVGTVIFSVDASAVADRSDRIPADGAVIAAQSIGIADGCTVYTVTTEAAKRCGILLDSDASGTYIRGIDGISERDFGALSGWVYRVNGEFPAVACTDYVLHPGDTVEWIYTLEPIID